MKTVWTSDQTEITYLNNYSANLNNNTFYHFAVNFESGKTPLGGGFYYIEGYKVSDAYEWQTARSYNQSGIRFFVRSKYNGTWTDWQAIN